MTKSHFETDISKVDLGNDIANKLIDYIGVPEHLLGFVLEDLQLEFNASLEEIVGALESGMKVLETHIKDDHQVDRIQKVFGPFMKIMQEDVEVTPSTGFVYVFKCGDLYKIGRSVDPSGRLKGINRGIPPNGEKVELVFTFEVYNEQAVEKTLHRVYADKLKRSDTGGQEWFELTKAELEAISWFLSDLEVQSDNSEVENE
jgi:hypothetical protein